MAHRVEVLETGQSFEVEAGETLLTAARRQGVRIYSDCEFGGCGTCRIRIMSGQAHYEDGLLPMSIDDDEHAQGYAAACQAMIEQPIQISIAQHIDELAAAQVLPARVQELKRVTSVIWRLRLQLDAASSLAYRPGQYLNLIDEQGVARSFSMATAVAEQGLLELHIREVQGGRFTQGVLPDLKVGHELSVEIPLGVFYYRERDWRPLIFVATGTGIAPIKAILEALSHDPDCPPVHLYWGMRAEQDLYLEQDIASWQSKFDDFSFVPVLSEASAQWQGARGFVQHQVCRDHPDLSEHAVYLCGSPQMIQEAREMLIQQGALDEYIYADAFNFQHDQALQGTPEKVPA